VDVEDRGTRVESALVLEHGQPLLFGAKGHRRGIRIEQGVPSVLEVPEGADSRALGVALHDESHESPAYAFSLASLVRPAFPTPIGVFRAVAKPTYEALLEQQVRDAIAARGPGDLRKLLHSGDTWTVEG
jgi:2-oxoglutarate ferredoxin oxidoreductase subunit beta